MDYCRFHPLAASVNYCPHCELAVCRACSDEGSYGDESKCLLCGGGLESRGVPVDVVPFWRRIEQSFKYPMTGPVIGFVIGMSLLMALGAYLPLPVSAGISLLLWGTLLKYCFNCLTETARGNMEAADISDAFSGGGVMLYLRLILINIIQGILIGVVFALLGNTAGVIFSIFFIVATPAIIIVYAMSESVLYTVNPMNLLRLMGNIGLPYGLLLAIIMVMIGSVFSISSLIGYGESIPVVTLQLAVGNFYMIVLFHMMGYMIYQYHDKLGHDIDDQLSAVDPRPENERQLVRIQNLIKEGRWQEVDDVARHTLQRFPNDDTIHTLYYKFALKGLPGALRNSIKIDGTSDDALPVIYQQTAESFDHFLRYLKTSDQTSRLRLSYLEIITVFKAYRPGDLSVAYAIAKACYDAGDFKTCVSLMNGIHKRYSGSPLLVTGYELMIRALREIPGMENNIQQCEKLVAALKKMKSVAPPEPSVQNPPAQVESPPTESRGAIASIESKADDKSIMHGNEDDVPKELPSIEFK